MAGPFLTYLGETRLALGPVQDAEPQGNWRTGMDDEGIAWLVLDCPDTGTNTVSEDVISELESHVEWLEQEKPRALVIRSAKAGGFAAGADIEGFADLADSGAIDLLWRGHGVLDRIEALPFPTVAIVHGAALGAGFEIALACDHRLAIDGASFGFPEVQLGLHPGLGGTFRLTERIDPTEAMTLMLTGKSAHTRKAKKLGIADRVIEERHVRNALREVAEGDLTPTSPGLKGRAVQTRPGRSIAARQMRKQTEAKAPKEHYPAPHALIDLWEADGSDRDAMQTAEIESFAKLLKTETSRNLIRAFFLRQNLKAAGRGDSHIRDVHVIGAGAMGGDIAAWAAIKGARVTLFDVESAALGRAVKDARKACEDAHLSSIEARDALDRLMPDPKSYGVARADLVIEAVPEKADLKAKVYESLSDMKDGAILASNTSSLRLTDLAGDAPDAGRFAGLHFFNPVPKMQLVEVVRHAGTSADTINRLMAFCGDIDRLPAGVSDHPGFLVNRALTPYLMEALALLDEGIDKNRIDGAALAFGMPMGPIALADQVGLDICLDVAESLRADLDKPMAEIPDWVRGKVEAGETGKKAGKGLWDWSDGAPQPEAKRDDDLADRMILPMLDACVECLRLDIVPDEDVVDGAMIFATGFAPFRGGPMHYARSRGVKEIVQRLEQFKGAHGPRFAPDDGWGRLAG